MDNEASVRDAIENAETVSDPLEGLLERAKESPGAAFTTEVVARLSELMGSDRPLFEDLRDRLKKETRVRVSELDLAIAKARGGEGEGPITPAEIMLELVADAELFHTADDVAYADIIVDGHRETLPVNGRMFRRWVTQRFYLETRSAPNAEALQSTLSVVQARAYFEGPEREVWVRVGGADGKIYLDLANEEWQAIEIDDSGWRVVSDPPVRFRRSTGMEPLPIPERGGSIDLLRPYLNLSKKSDFVLIVAWLLAALRERGPYPVMGLSGEQGTAKSTLSRVLRGLVDPNVAPLRALSDGDRDLFIAATNAHVLSFDNVSGLRAWISDSLCRLATGGGFATRQLWTDQDEILFTATRPIVLNGIEDIVSRPDLGDRAILLTLEPISKEKRKPEKVLWAELEAARPKILGALLDGVVHGLRRIATTPYDTLPRMADFAHWIAACEGAFWPAGTFAEAYDTNQADAVGNMLEADPVASAIQALMRTTTAEWKGNATDLLAELAERTSDAVKKSPTWPKTPQLLSGRVRRAATVLRAAGIHIGFKREGHEHKRSITISFTEPEKQVPSSSASSASSAGTDNALKITSLSALDLRTVTGDADADPGSADGSTVRTNPLGRTGADGADDADDESSSFSAGWRERL